MADDMGFLGHALILLFSNVKISITIISNQGYLDERLNKILKKKVF